MASIDLERTGMSDQMDKHDDSESLPGNRMHGVHGRLETSIRDQSMRSR